MLITNTTQANYQYNKPIFKADLQTKIAQLDDKNLQKAENIANNKSILIEKYINNSSTIAVATLGRNIFSALNNLETKDKEQISNIKAKPLHRVVEDAYMI